MTIEISYLAAANQQSSRWSGGSTTELAIFPPEASYAARDFAWRISTASVDATESTFTTLPEFQRLLLVLEGEMHLDHQGHHDVTLHPLEQDRFCGSWITHCQGKGRDYNLMLAEGWRGDLRPLLLTGSASQHLILAAGQTAAFYCFAGELTIALPGQSKCLLSASDFLSLTVRDQETEIEVSFWTESAATVITAMVERTSDRDKARAHPKVVDIKDYEKTQATLRLMNELAKGRNSGEQEGWLEPEHVRAYFSAKVDEV